MFIKTSDSKGTAYEYAEAKRRLAGQSDGSGESQRGLFLERPSSDRGGSSSDKWLLLSSTASPVTSRYQGLITQEDTTRNAEERGHRKDRMARGPEVRAICGRGSGV